MKTPSVSLDQAGPGMADVDAAIAEEIMEWSRTPAGWMPSRHAHQAWHVVERMAELGFAARIDVQPEPPRIQVGFARPGAGAGQPFSETSVELAICLAALDTRRRGASRLAAGNGDR